VQIMIQAFKRNAINVSDLILLMWLFENLRWRPLLTRAFQDCRHYLCNIWVWVTAFYSVGRFEWPVWHFDCFKTAGMNYHDDYRWSTLSMSKLAFVAEEN